MVVSIKNVTETQWSYTPRRDLYTALYDDVFNFCFREPHYWKLSHNKPEEVVKGLNDRFLQLIKVGFQLCRASSESNWYRFWASVRRSKHEERKTMPSFSAGLIELSAKE